jgi:hypothetical protein
MTAGRGPVFRAFFEDVRANRGALVVHDAQSGARLTDRSEERVMADGTVIPHLIYAITRAELAAGPLARGD